MSRVNIHLITFLFGVLGLSLYNCESCDDCGPLQKEPTITFKFVNQDSLTIIQENLLSLNAGIDEINTSLETIAVEIQFYNDSIQTINRLITEGDNNLDNLRNLLQAKTDSLQTTFVNFQNLRLEEEEKVNILLVTENDIENGKIRIDSLTSTVTEASVTFGSDSLESFRFPLSINDDATTYGIFISGVKYELSLEYERNFNEDERSRIEVIVSNIKIGSHTFKEAINSCEVCISNETSITVFF